MTTAYPPGPATPSVGKRIVIQSKTGETCVQTNLGSMRWMSRRATELLAPDADVAVTSMMPQSRWHSAVPD